MPEPSVDKAWLRKQTIETLRLLVERYPNLPMCTIIGSAVGDNVYGVTDVDMARGFNQLFVSLTQFEAAGIKP